MGRVFDAQAYAFGLASLPYAVVAMCMLVLLAYLAFTRGDPTMRMALIGAVTASAVWAVGQCVALAAVEYAAALRWQRIMMAPVGLIGPSLMALMLANSGRLRAHRGIVALGLGLALVGGVLTLQTPLVVREMYLSPSGLWFGRAGSLLPPFVGILVLWAGGGAVVAARGLRSIRIGARARHRRLFVIGVLCTAGATDSLLAYGIGWYPMSWIGALAIAAVALRTAARGELFRERGLDGATRWELAIAASLGLTGYGLFRLAASAGDAGPLVVAVAGVPLLLAAQLGASATRRRVDHAAGKPAAAIERAADKFVAHCAEIRTHEQLLEVLRELLEGELRLNAVRLYEAEGDKLRGIPDGDERAVDERVKGWMIANRRALLSERLDVEPLSGLRKPIQAFMRSLDADVVMPMVDRDSLVGAIVAAPRDDDRALSDAAVRVLSTVQEATGRALMYLRLYREAEAKIEVAREVEIAAAVQHGRASDDARLELAGCRVLSFYQPAGQFGGDWWTARELSDGRILAVIGDVTGHGVPAALVTATVEGACETSIRLLASGFDVYTFLQLVNRSVLGVGRGRYLMSCFALVYDDAQHELSFASAGHPFPYVVRSPPEGRGRSELRSLVSRGTPLGMEAEPVFDIGRLEVARGDLVVMYTDALVESKGPDRAAYGERRLRRVLRSRAWAAGDGVCAVIMDDAREHYGSVPIAEDVTLVCLRIS